MVKPKEKIRGRHFKDCPNLRAVHGSGANATERVHGSGAEVHNTRIWLLGLETSIASLSMIRNLNTHSAIGVVENVEYFLEHYVLLNTQTCELRQKQNLLNHKLRTKREQEAIPSLVFVC